MINYQDQMELFKVVSNSIKEDVGCYAFGGTAMMFYGYKDETKDIDLLFGTERERNEFTRVLESMGFYEKTATNIYVPEKLKDKHKPLIYQRYDIRFDIFVKKIFKTLISPKMREDVYAVHDFKDKHNLKVNVMRKEHIILLKAVTERDRDFEDIVTITRKEKNLDWQYIVDEAIWQYKNGSSWILIDAEKMLKELKKYAFIEQKYLKQLHEAQKLAGLKSYWQKRPRQ